MKRFYFLYLFGRGNVSQRLFVLALAFVGSVVLSASLQAQVISVTGNQTLTITSAVIGSEPTSVVNTSSTLSYKRRSVITKITVGTSCPNQSFTLKVLAVSPTAGNAAPEVSLTDGMPATDFIINIPSGGTSAWRTASLRYTASATFAQGNSTEQGNDIHTITYTLVVQ